jgi:hypothetical protein
MAKRVRQLKDLLNDDYRPRVGHFEENLLFSVILCFGGEAKAF